MGREAFLFLFILTSTSYAIEPQSLSENWKFTTTPNLRLSYQSATNTGDLKDNAGTNLGYSSFIYNIPLGLRYTSKLQFFINLSVEGPSHYAAPFKDVTTSVEGSDVKKNGGENSALYPILTEAWIKFHPTLDHSLQVGQSGYIVGNGYALGGQYKNYGATYTYEKSQNFRLRLRYSAFDVENGYSTLRKNTHSKWLGRNSDSSAYMTAIDLTVTPLTTRMFSLTVQPYGGLLHDQTPLAKRNQRGYFANINTLTGPTYVYQPYQTKTDDIFTYGLSATLDSPLATFNVEFAQNAGQTKGETTGNQDWGNITHLGYLLHSELKGRFGIFTPRGKMVIASGNEVATTDPTNYYNATLKRNKNKAFTVFSPLNTNLVDSFAHMAPVPMVAMAGGYTMNYGIRRPGTFNDPHVWENLNAYNLGLDVAPTEKLFVMANYWMLRAMNAGIGQDSAGTVRFLSKDLGSEIDGYLSYSVTNAITVGLHGGYFIPGSYYKEVRSDVTGDWSGNLAQTTRVDGSADKASQIETFITLRF